ncbi:MAG: hypothetical protein HQ592_10205 [Planctomycetes bacterium]|nr:hypothetical protein [Planctomycetota bacterium]
MRRIDYLAVAALITVLAGCKSVQRRGDSHPAGPVAEQQHGDENIEAEEPESSALGAVGNYFKNRGNDLVDVFDGTGIGAGIGLEASVKTTDYAKLCVGGSWSHKVALRQRSFEESFDEVRVGIPCLQMSIVAPFVDREYTPFLFAVPATYLEYKDQGQQTEFAITVFLTDAVIQPGESARNALQLSDSEDRGPLIDRFDVELSATALVPSAALRFSPGQLLDFVLGWVGVGIGKDDSRIKL